MLCLLLLLTLLPVKDSLITYDSAKYKVIATREGVRRTQKNIETTFTECIVNRLIPYWYGTPWDFNGITQKPKQGNIACGYFVTTILRDAGFKVQRVKVAQKAASEIIREVADRSTIRAFSLKSVNFIDSAVKKMGQGVYVVGLDYHVGFLYNDGKDVYFIHSNYIGREGVVKESILHSRAFANSKLRVVGKLSTATCLKEKWLN